MKNKAPLKDIQLTEYQIDKLDELEKVLDDKRIDKTRKRELIENIKKDLLVLNIND